MAIDKTKRLCSLGGGHDFKYASTELVVEPNTSATYNKTIGTWERAVCTKCGLITKNFVPTPTLLEEKK